MDMFSVRSDEIADQQAFYCCMMSVGCVKSLSGRPGAEPLLRTPR